MQDMHEKIKKIGRLIRNILSKLKSDPSVFPSWNGPIYDFNDGSEENIDIDIRGMSQKNGIQ